MHKQMNSMLYVEEVVLDSIEEVDCSDMKLPIIALFDRPKDYPYNVIARFFDGQRASNTIMIFNTLEEAVKEIRKTNAVFVPRDKRDDPYLVGSYLL